MVEATTFEPIPDREQYMPQALKGNTVKVHYTGTLDDGSTFDSSRGREPLEFTLGEGQIIPGFENGILGMECGEIRKLDIEPADAYGDHVDDLVQAVERDKIPEDIDVSVGARLEVQMQNGESTVVTVIDSDDDSVTMDGNHPLAGETLHFEVELVEIA